MNIEKILSELTLEEKADLCSGKDFWRTKPIERLQVPAVMISDGPHGLRKQKSEGDHLGITESIKAVCFPASCAVACSFDTELAYKLGETLGEECQAENLAMLLGPGVNIKRNPLGGRNFEYYSEDPYLAGKMAASVVNGMQSRGVSACVKHFAANNQETLRMSSDSVIDERTLYEIYLAAFETIVKESSPASIMCAYNRVNGTYCAENHDLLTDVLREKWGFNGFVVTDWGAVKDAANGIKAGLDLIMPGGNPAYSKRILAAVKDGTLSEEELDGAVRRILQFVDKTSSCHREGVKFDREKDYKIAVEIAKESAVLLKNEGGILPLAEKSKVAFIGAFAQSPRYQGSGSSHINSAKVENALDFASTKGLNVVYVQGYPTKSSDEETVLLKEAVQAAKSAEATVLFVGLPDSYETEGMDRVNNTLPLEQNRLISAVAAVQPHTVVVLHNGSSVEMPWIKEVSAVLELYLAGDGAGEAAVELLFGKVNPSGKLAESFPLHLQDSPSYLNFPGERGKVEYREGVFVGYRYYDKRNMEVLFPFGHGLSYTQFSYSDLQIEKTRITDQEALTVSCVVKNIGAQFGKEVVQLYVGDKECEVNRPVRELKGFKKIALNPGESKKIFFTLDKRSFAYYDIRLHDFYVESGDFTVELGSSSRDIRLTGNVNVQSTEKVPVRFDRETTMGEVMKSEKGRMIMASMRSRMQQKGGGDGVRKGLGEGADALVQNMMKEMTIGSLVSFGGLSEEMVDGFIAMLNS